MAQLLPILATVIIPFGVAFAALQPNSEKTSYANNLVSWVTRILVMAIGELDFNNIALQNWLNRTIFIIFIFVGLLFTNALIGFAVSDTADLAKSAKAQQLRNLALCVAGAEKIALFFFGFENMSIAAKLKRRNNEASMRNLTLQQRGIGATAAGDLEMVRMTNAKLVAKNPYILKISPNRFERLTVDTLVDGLSKDVVKAAMMNAHETRNRRAKLISKIQA